MVVSPAMLQVVDAPKQKRVLRNPKHGFNLSYKPFALYPMMIAPVLPGETLKSLQYQCRSVTDPVDSPIIGWWHETYFFYVKCRDTPLAADFEAMILDPADTGLVTGEGSSDNTKRFFAPGAGNAIDWVAACLESVTEAYFRSEDETWNTYVNSDNMPALKFPGVESTWANSVFAASELPTDDVEYTAVADESFRSFETRWRQWLLLRQQALTDMTWEDYLATFGVNIKGPGKGKPELIRFFKDWQYPSNTITQGTGAASSAVSWALSERADKDRFFTEPGFIFGVTAVRTKTYPTAQVQNASVMLDSALSWMPAILKDDPASSMRRYASGSTNSPLDPAIWAVDHIIDIRDLYLYGDNFFHTDNLQVDAPGSLHRISARDITHFGTQYPQAAAVDTLFTDRDPATAVRVREDGVVKLHILGTQIDHT